MKRTDKIIPDVPSRMFHDESRRFYVRCLQDGQMAFESDSVSVRFPDGLFKGRIKRLKPNGIVMEFAGRDRGMTVGFDRIEFKN